MNVRRVKALIWKEFKQIVRDPSSILIAFIFPLLLLFIYGTGVSLDMDHLKIGIVLEERKPASEDFAFSLVHSQYFDMRFVESEKEAADLITKGDIDGFIVVPFYFSYYKERASQKRGPLYVVGDGSSPNTATFVTNYVRGAWLNWQIQQKSAEGQKIVPGAVLEPRYWYNEELSSQFFLLPGSIAIIMTLIGTLLTALVVAREWERGTIEALMATPVTMGEIIISKMFCYLCLGLGSMILCTLITIFIYGVPFRGTFLALLLVSTIFLIASLGVGLWISFVARNQFVAAQVAIVTAFLPAFMLSGFIFEISSMPALIQATTHILPARYLVSSLQTLFLVGNVWPLLLVNMAITAVIAAILLFIIKIKAQKRLDA